MSTKFFVLLLGYLFSIIYALPARNNLRQFGCDDNGRCSMMVSLLRDPRMMPAWRKDTWNKALAQINGYQELFGGVSEEAHDDIPDEAGPRDRRSVVDSYNRPVDEENLYWMIKLGK